MVQLKFSKGLKPTAEESVPVQGKKQNLNLGSLWSTYKIPFDFIACKIFHPIFSVWLFYRLILLIMIENLGPAFVEVSQHFSFTFMSLNLGPGVNYVLWISAFDLIMSSMCHLVVCFGVLCKEKPINRFSKLLAPEFLPIQLVKCFSHNFVCGLVLLGLHGFCSSPQILSLLCLHTCSGLVAFGYYMANLKAAKQSPKSNSSSNGITTDALVSNTSGISVKVENQERKGWFWSSTYQIVQLVFTVWLNLCVFSSILKTNLGPAFVDASKHFGLTNQGYSLDFCEPIINLGLWLFVVILHHGAFFHANICFNLLVGSNTKLNLFGQPLETNRVVEWLQGSLASAFGCALTLFRLCEFYLSPQILSLLTLHTCSGLMVLSYYKIQKTTKQTSTPKGGSDDIPTIIVTLVA